MSYLCIFWLLTLYQIYDLQILSPIQQIAFSFCCSFLCCAEAFQLQSHLFIFSVVAFAFSVRSKNHDQDRYRETYPYGSFQEFYDFRSCVQVFNPFCLWCKIMVQFYSFTCGCPVFPMPLVEETVLSPLYILGSSVVT